MFFVFNAHWSVSGVLGRIVKRTGFELRTFMIENIWISHVHRLLGTNFRLGLVHFRLRRHVAGLLPQREEKEDVDGEADGQRAEEDEQAERGFESRLEMNLFCSQT